MFATGTSGRSRWRFGGRIVFVVSLAALVGCDCTKEACTTAASSCNQSCTLTPAQLAARRQELIPGLFKRAQLVSNIPSGIRFRFAGEPKLLSDLARLIEQEQDCCSFLRFQLTIEPSSGPVTLEVTGPPDTAEMLRKFAATAEN